MLAKGDLQTIARHRAVPEHQVSNYHREKSLT
jgi:hypothetical protein